MLWVWASLGIAGESWQDCRPGDPCMAKIEAACAEGRGDVCTLLGRAAESRPKQARKHFERACELGDGEGCERLAFLGVDHPALGLDAAARYGLHAKACDLGYATACVNAATALRAGDGVAADPARADRMLAEACATTARACLLRAKHAPDDAAAYPWVERACDAGDPMGCDILGAMRRDGQGTPRDPEGAREAFRKACTGGVQEACAQATVR